MIIKNLKVVPSPVPQNNEDGVDHYLTSGFFGSYVDIEGVYRSEYDLIRRYREMALHPEVDGAIEDIVNEAIVSDTNDSPVEIELSNLNVSDGLKKKIREEFKYILELLDFDKKAHEIYRNWYVDGRLYYHKVIDIKNPTDGIQELRYIDALKMRFVRQAGKVKKKIQSIFPTEKKIPVIAYSQRFKNTLFIINQQIKLELLIEDITPQKMESRCQKTLSHIALLV